MEPSGALSVAGMKQYCSRIKQQQQQQQTGGSGGASAAAAGTGSGSGGAFKKASGALGNVVAIMSGANMDLARLRYGHNKQKHEKKGNAKEERKKRMNEPR